MSSHSRSRAYAVLLLFVFMAGSSGRGQMDYGLNQVPYKRGQNVVPVFEGWERNPDGTFNMLFGYLNRNYEEELDIPIGPNNNVEPGGPDQGQPTFFRTRRHQFQFKVKVPKDWGVAKRLVWTLTIRGRTETANAFLLPEWELNDQVIAGHFGGSGGAPDLGDNRAPEISVGAYQMVTLPDPATLAALVSDDGLPRPPVARIRSRGATGASGVDPGPAPTTPVAAGAANASPAGNSRLRVEWVTWRRPAGGTVTFSPAVSPVIGGKTVTAAKPDPDASRQAATAAKSDPVSNGKAATTVRFGAPGKYVLKAFAFDGAVTTPSADITVIVNPASAAQSPYR